MSAHYEDEVEPSAGEVNSLVERALTFQEYILRRAWGVYFAIWAFAFLVFVAMGPLIAQGLSLSFPMVVVVLVGVYSLTGIITSVVTYRTFDLAWRAVALRLASTPASTGQSARSRSSSVSLFGLSLLPLLLALIVLGTGVWRPNELLAFTVPVDLATVPILVLVHYELRRSFRRVPFEGSVAISTYGAAILAALLSVIVTLDYWSFAVSWIVFGAGGWIFSGLYAMYHAPERLSGESEQ